jgi:hypothetical protein
MKFCRDSTKKIEMKKYSKNFIKGFEPLKVMNP